MTLWCQCSSCLHVLITQAINIPSGRGSSVFVLFLLQKKLIPWLCAIASFIFHLIMAQLCPVEAAVALFLLVGGFLQLSRGEQTGCGLQSVPPFHPETEKKMQSIKLLLFFDKVQLFSLSRTNVDQGSAVAKQMNAKHRNQWAVFSLKAGPWFVSRINSYGKADMGLAPTQTRSVP